MATMTITGQLVSVGPCIRCGVEVAMPDWMKTARLSDHAVFYCVQGHGQHYPEGKSENETLRAQVEDLKASRDHANQQRMAAQAEAERLRETAKKAAKRTAAGCVPLL